MWVWVWLCVNERLVEHKAAVRRGDTNNGIAVHAWDHQHRVDWEKASVLKQEPGYWKRRVLEAIEIQRHATEATDNYEVDVCFSCMTHM